tara:strand:+ start:118 stop:231 length:114 start_codon:yes stop_codon:yes gene_type:complete
LLVVAVVVVMALEPEPEEVALEVLDKVLVLRQHQLCL